MKKVNRIVSFVVILGLLAIVPASAQLDTTQDTDASNLGMLITINKLELTTDQMQQIRDILAGVLDETNALKEGRNAFEQEMLRFNGTGEELDVLVEAFREEQSAQASALQENAQGALEDLKEILTLKQGETLGNTLSHLAKMWPTANTLRGEQLGAGRLGRLPEVIGERLSPEMRERVMDRMRERIGEKGEDAGRMREFPSSRPGFEIRLKEQGWRGFAEGGPLGRPDAFEPDGEQSRSHPFLARQFGGRALTRLEQLVELLGMKLQYVE